MRATTVIEKEISETIRLFVTWVTVSCLSGDVGFPHLLTHSLGVIISILNFTIHYDAKFLSCRAFIRRPLLCYCRRLVSDYDPCSFSNQLVFIGPRQKIRRFWQLSFPSASWFGDEIQIFDPGIVGSQIDNDGKLTMYLMQTPVRITVFRHDQRKWWRVISLSLNLRIYDGKSLPCISFSSKEFERPLTVGLCLWRCLIRTRFTRWKRCNRRSIVKIWKRITSYGEIVTEGVCRSTHGKCVDRHKSGTGTTSEVGVFFFSELVLVDAMKASTMFRWESIDTRESETRIGTVVQDFSVAFDVKTFTDVYGVKRTIG